MYYNEHNECYLIDIGMISLQSQQLFDLSVSHMHCQCIAKILFVKLAFLIVYLFLFYLLLYNHFKHSSE